MEYTVQFYRWNTDSDREVLHEVIMCDTDTTRLKRQVTKIAKLLKIKGSISPFKILQEKCPQSWEGYGPVEKGFSKQWTPYDANYPLNEKCIYGISVTQSSKIFEAAKNRVSEASYKLLEAKEKLTVKRYSFDPDISLKDPEIAEIINGDLLQRLEAVMAFFDGAKRRLKDKIQELNEKEL